jgi:hypothetical protein
MVGVLLIHKSINFIPILYKPLVEKSPPQKDGIRDGIKDRVFAWKIMNSRLTSFM